MFSIKKIVGTYKCEGFNSFEFKNISFLSENCKFIDTSLVDSTFDSCTFDVNALQNVAFIGCKFIDCKVKKKNPYNIKIFIVMDVKILIKDLFLLWKTH